MSALCPLSGVKRSSIAQIEFFAFDPKRTRVCPLLLRSTASTCYTRHSPWALGSSRCSGASSLACSAATPLRLLHWPHEKTDWEKNHARDRSCFAQYRNNGLLLTDADAKRRSSAQASQAAGASRSWCATYGRKGISDNCSYATQQQCLAQVWGLGGFCRPNPFPGTAYGTGYTWSSGPSR